eukprot:COSAG02_NODE_40_length_47766_cov_88.053119_15_plen_149_part_00
MATSCLGQTTDQSSPPQPIVASNRVGAHSLWVMPATVAVAVAALGTLDCLRPDRSEFGASRRGYSYNRALATISRNQLCSFFCSDSIILQDAPRVRQAKGVQSQTSGSGSQSRKKHKRQTADEQHVQRTGSQTSIRSTTEKRFENAAT